MGIDKQRTSKVSLRKLNDYLKGKLVKVQQQGLGGSGGSGETKGGAS